MFEITAENAAAYLQQVGLVANASLVRSELLGWGVSNVVVKARVEGNPTLVLKQSREKLRTTADWFSRLDRIWTESAALGLLSDVVPPGVVPQVLFKDLENFVFVMSCAPEDSIVWKEQLLAGECDCNVAKQAGTILAAFHRVDPDPASPLGDLEVFDQLRIDPFYQRIMSVHESIRTQIADLMEEMAVVKPGFVHADFSPKNILVHGQGLTVVDFETAHRGDQAFDLGFFLSHLVLKALRAAPAHEPYLMLIHAFLDAYGCTDPDIIRRGIAHTAACGLARIDGKSPVDYLTEPKRKTARELMINILTNQPDHWSDFLDMFAAYLSV